jgi:hypothetical protein
MHYFLRFKALHLNHSNSKLVGKGSDGMPATAAAIAAAGIAIEGHAITPVEHRSTQHAKSTALQLFVHAVSMLQISVRLADIRAAGSEGA